MPVRLIRVPPARNKKERARLLSVLKGPHVKLLSVLMERQRRLQEIEDNKLYCVCNCWTYDEYCDVQMALAYFPVNTKLINLLTECLIVVQTGENVLDRAFESIKVNTYEFPYMLTNSCVCDNDIVSDYWVEEIRTKGMVFFKSKQIRQLRAQEGEDTEWSFEGDYMEVATKPYRVKWRARIKNTEIVVGTEGVPIEKITEAWRNHLCTVT